MLRSLSIKNIALIDRVEIQLCKGLNILTGETGAGKSIIIDSINLLKGERTNKDLIRNSETKASVEGLFELSDFVAQRLSEDFGIDVSDGELIISREITLDGKNTIRVNGSMVTLSMLREIGEYLINIHGQHDNTSLLLKKTHIDFLDSYGGSEIEDVLNDYISVHQEISSVQDRLENMQTDDAEKSRREEMLSYQIDEIEKASLISGEEESLEDRYRVLSNAENISRSLLKAYTEIYDGDDYAGSAHDTLWNGINSLDEVTGFDQKLKDIHSSLTDAGYAIADAMRDLKDYIDSLSYNKQELFDIEERLNLIYELKRKYGSSIDEILAYLEKIREELSEINNSEEEINKLQIKLQSLIADRENKAKMLTALRKRCANQLEKNIKTQLNDLDMGKVEFEVSINECGFNSNGADDVEFMICTNVGEDFKPLSKTASGGELSRIMLAIKCVLADSDNVKTLVFDEVDTGVSGRAAQKLGEKLYLMSKSAQVICITHLPQIAAMADTHFLIEKSVGGERTKTSVTPLGRDMRIKEMARTLGGAQITDITLKNAEQLLMQADDIKK